MKVYKHRQIKYSGKITFKGIEKENYFKEITLLDNEIREEMHKNQVIENVSRQNQDNEIYNVDNANEEKE